jgi:hypothetical protein
MAPGKSRDPRNEQQWRRWLRLCQQSVRQRGLGQADGGASGTGVESSAAGPAEEGGSRAPPTKIGLK